ncbi:hypothetical protein BC628DRAFT_1390986 [Trametes gibbosa]|nr:hypothetical protein BC628DRAFT_1390986 [Trametes gibbosa]
MGSVGPMGARISLKAPTILALKKILLSKTLATPATLAMLFSSMRSRQKSGGVQTTYASSTKDQPPPSVECENDEGSSEESSSPYSPQWPSRELLTLDDLERRGSLLFSHSFWGFTKTSPRLLSLPATTDSLLPFPRTQTESCLMPMPTITSPKAAADAEALVLLNMPRWPLYELARKELASPFLNFLLDICNTQAYYSAASPTLWEKLNTKVLPEGPLAVRGHSDLQWPGGLVVRLVNAKYGCWPTTLKLLSRTKSAYI